MTKSGLLGRLSSSASLSKSPQSAAAYSCSCGGRGQWSGAVYSWATLLGQPRPQVLVWCRQLGQRPLQRRTPSASGASRSAAAPPAVSSACQRTRRACGFAGARGRTAQTGRSSGGRGTRATAQGAGLGRGVFVSHCAASCLGGDGGERSLSRQPSTDGGAEQRAAAEQVRQGERALETVAKHPLFRFPVVNAFGSPA